MDINQLKYFISVAQTLNFSEAARRNGLTQPSISHHISELEKQLGVCLFIRDKRSVVLTDAGRTFLPNAVEIVELTQKSILQLGKIDAGQQGSLTIAALTTCSSVLSRCLAAFSAIYPDITIDIHYTSGWTQSLIMNENRYDIHFAATEMVPTGSTFSSIALGTDRLCVALPGDHPLCRVFDEKGVIFPLLSGERFIACSQNDGPALYQSIMNVCASRNYTPNITCQHDRAEAILLSVGAGLGISIIPETLREVSYSENVRLYPIEGGDALRHYVMAWHSAITNPAVELFVRTASSLYPDSVIQG